MTPEERIRHIIQIHADWEDPLPLLRRLFDTYSAELATWRDPWGNGFFWYLYFREPVSRPVIEALPDTITATFELKNRFGVSPADLWQYCRPQEQRLFPYGKITTYDTLTAPAGKTAGTVVS